MIKQWQNVSHDSGVYAGSMVMTDNPVLGDWTIKATCTSHVCFYVNVLYLYIHAMYSKEIRLIHWGYSNSKLFYSFQLQFWNYIKVLYIYIYTVYWKDIRLIYKHFAATPILNYLMVAIS